jgi:hypothetical protein
MKWILLCGFKSKENVFYPEEAIYIFPKYPI